MSFDIASAEVARQDRVEIISSKETKRSEKGREKEKEKKRKREEGRDEFGSTMT